MQLFHDLLSGSYFIDHNMANITPRTDKSGNIISYQIRVFRGRDASGKRLKDYMMTWKPTPGMTKRQIEKELTRQATLFEENCKLGSGPLVLARLGQFGVVAVQMVGTDVLQL